MKAGIIGLPLCGKTTLFNVLTKRNVATGGYSSGTGPNIGSVKVPDERLDRLSDIFRPKKTTHASVEYVDVAGLTKGSVHDGGLGSQQLAHIRNVDLLIHVVRTFTSQTVPAPEGGIDPLRDSEILHLELLLADLGVAEKRVERLRVDIQKKGQKEKIQELQLMERLKDRLEQEIPLRNLDFTDDEQKLLRGYQFLTAKPMLLVLNIGEDEIRETAAYQGLCTQYEAQGIPTVMLSAEIESELEQLEDEDDIRAFMEDIGISELGLTKLIRVSYDLLRLISFFTVESDEVKAWTIPKNTKAVHAAGVIHSDLERGFIRAEVIPYEEFLTYGTMANAKQHGVVRVEGKEYLVQDGDIIMVRFNV
jgi:GTP-binding protein YchF